MNERHIIVIGLILVLIFVGLSGCVEDFLDELEDAGEDNYITVTVTCYTRVDLKTSSGEILRAPDIIVNTKIVKAGGERVESTETTDEYGNTKALLGTFKVYRKQPIVCYANAVLSSTEKYPGYTFNSDVYEITRDDIFRKTDFGETTHRTVVLYINGVPS